MSLSGLISIRFSRYLWPALCAHEVTPFSVKKRKDIDNKVYQFIYIIYI